MRHRLKKQLYGYKQGPRKALIRSLVYALVENGRIQTSFSKAKEAKRHIEKALTQAKKNTLHSRRILLSRFPNQKVVSLLVDRIAPEFKERKGGYTRLIKTASRSGDAAKMAFLEFVHYDKETYKEKYALSNKIEVKEKKAQKKKRGKKGKSTQKVNEEEVKKVSGEKGVKKLEKKLGDEVKEDIREKKEEGGDQRAAQVSGEKAKETLGKGPLQDKVQEKTVQGKNQQAENQKGNQNQKEKEERKKNKDSE